MTELSITGGGPAISATRGGTDDDGDARVVMLHGLTATRHYTVMGSRHLDRRGIANVAYDARGHGTSGAGKGPGDYTYEALSGDLGRVLDDVSGGGPVVVLGISMGAHTAVRFAIDHPERIAGLLLITPAYLPGPQAGDRSAWHQLAAALRGPDPIDAFVVASHLETLPEGYRDQVEMALRQRIGRHASLAAVADALEGVPESSPFDSMDDLARVTAPTIIVGSRDEVDPSHPFHVARTWAQTISGARLEVEEAGKSPLAWQGGRLARYAEELTPGGA